VERLSSNEFAQRRYFVRKAVSRRPEACSIRRFQLREDWDREIEYDYFRECRINRGDVDRHCRFVLGSVCIDDY
jgi:hypothetical protein